MADKFSSHVSSINSPPENIFGVTPDDGADLPNASRVTAYLQRMYLASVFEALMTIRGKRRTTRG